MKTKHGDIHIIRVFIWVYQMHITVEFGKNATIKLKALAYLVMIESSECMCVYIYCSSAFDRSSFWVSGIKLISNDADTVYDCRSTVYTLQWLI